MQQRTSQKGACRNHPSKEGPYFLTDQPWINFCSECALNVAIFGKNISKNHSAQQLTQKSNINSWYNKINASLTQISLIKKSIDIAISSVQQNIFQSLVNSIKKVEEYLQKMYDFKEELKKTYNQLLQNKISQYYDRQTKLTVNELKIKHEIQEIESSAQNLIEGKSELSVEQKIQKWEELIRENEALALSEKDIQKIYSNGREIEVQIRQKLEQIYRYKLDINFDKQSRSNKQNFSTLHDSEIIENSKIHTRLKLRSQPKTSSKKERNSLSFARKSFRDSTNISTLSAFQY